MKDIRENKISDNKDKRIDMCKELGFESLWDLHGYIVGSLKHGSNNLLLRGLTAEVLIELGYSAEGMEKIGYQEDTLIHLGYPNVHRERMISDCGSKPFQTYYRNYRGNHYRFTGTRFEAGRYQEIRELIRLGYRAKTLKSRGFNILYCKNAGFSARDLLKIGFNVSELVNVFSINELRDAGCFPHELESFYTREQLLSAGYTLDELILAGYSREETAKTNIGQGHI